MRLRLRQIMQEPQGFNPRICKRCDIIGPATSAGGTVSIHASVKDATASKFAVRDQVSVSIHASVKDATCISLFVGLLNFGFNPRICKRCDREVANVTLAFYVSIHASVKDATQARHFNSIIGDVSIHASVKDAT